ncbi:hypothetical protein [Streptomyces sp. NPDC057682]|uniref:hypothetical protein n=1 Tax=Streptomyces sp. NPDC057682 TaxID=3346210 RepID=UPI0036BE36C2
MTDPAALDALLRLCPPPADPPPAPDWAAAEKRLGTGLPEDYKRLVEAYGDGLFDETIWLLSPEATADLSNLHEQRTERDGVLESLWLMDEEKPDGLLEEGAYVIPWAFEEGSGAFLYWLVRPGQHPDAWTLLFNEGRGPLWEPHAMRCVDFVLAVLTGTAETAYFGRLYEILKPTAHRFETTAQVIGAPGR